MVSTGVTRGNCLVVLVGQRTALAIAVKERGRGGGGRSYVKWLTPDTLFGGMKTWPLQPQIDFPII